MAALTLRTVKGTPLTNSELDANFTSLNTELGQKLVASSNLSDLANAATARTNLGLGNVENKSSSTIRGELTSSNVTTALGFTPYNATNPSGFISGITSSMVTTALGYTPYNSTNPNGYITSAALSSYLPLSSGTLTGPLEISTGATNGNYNEGLRLTAANNGWAGITFGSTGLSGMPTNGWFAARNPSNQFIVSPGTSDATVGLTLNSGGNALWRNSILLHASNYSNYALPLSGGTLSGAIRAPQITAGGSTNTDVQFGVQGTAHLAGDTYLGGTVGNVNSWSAKLSSSAGTTTLSGSRFVVDRFGYGSQPLIDAQLSLITLGQPTRIEGGIRQGADMARPLAQWSATSATGMVYFELPGTTSNYGMIHAVIDIYEYNSNSVSTVIVGGHNWNGAWYNVGANVIGQTDKAVRLGVRGGKYVICIGSAGSSWSYGTVVLRKIHNGGYYTGIMDMGATFVAAITTSESLTSDTGDLRALRTPAGFNAGGAITQAGNQVLHAGNYSSYALPLSGGTMSGDLTVPRIRGVNSLALNTYTTVNPSSNVFLYSQGNDRDAWIFLDSADTGSNWGIYHRQIDSAVSGLPGNSIGFVGGGSSGLQAWISLANGSANFAGALTQAGNQVLHAGNYSSYALPLSGGNVTGAVSVVGQTINGQSHYQWEGGTFRNPGDWTASFIARRDNATAGINGHIPSLVLYNNNGGDQTTVGLSFASAEGATGQGNAVALAGILARKEGAGNVGGWSSGSLNFYVKNGGTRVDAINISSAGNVNALVALQQAGNQVLHAGNYTSYAAIGTGFTNGGDLNTFTTSGMYRINNTEANRPGDWGQLLVIHGGSDTITQLYGQYNGSMYYRSGNPTNVGGSGSYSAWKTLLDSSNYSSYALPLSGGTLSGNVIAPNFLSSANNSYGVFGNNGYFDTVNGRGSDPLELNYYEGGPVKIGSGTNGSKSLYAVGIYDNGNQVLHAGNYSSYLNNTYMRSIGYASSSNDWNSLGNTYPNTVEQVDPSNFSSTANGPTAASYTYGTLLNFSSQSSSQAQIYISHAGNDLIFRGGWNGSSWQTWNKVLTNQNYTSYSPTLTGGGASGTWGINVTGSAGSATSAGYLTGGDSAFYGLLYNSLGGDLNTYNSPGLYSAEYTGATNRPVASNGHYIQISDAGGTDVKTQWYFENTGVTPYMRLMWGNGNWKPWQALLTSGNYSSYALPLSGGTLSGELTLSGNNTWFGGLTYLRSNTAFSFLTNSGSAQDARFDGIQVSDSYAGSIPSNGILFGTDTQLVRAGSGQLDLGGNRVIHAGNWSNYVQIPYTGWPGSPGTDANTFLGGNWLRSSFTYSNNAPWTGPIFSAPAGGYDLQINGQYSGHEFSIRSRNGDAGSWMAWKRILTDYNYNSWAPSLTGSGASGTWGINVTGNAGSATTAGRASATTVPASTAFVKWLFATSSTSGTLDWNHVSNTNPGVGESLLLGTATNGPGGGSYYHPFNIEYAGIDGVGNVTQMAIAYGNTGNELYMRGRYGGTWTGWSRYLNSSNYSSYALPLSGGALTGSLSIQGSNYINLASATYSNVGVIVGNWSGAGWWGLGSESGHILKFDQVSGNTFQGASDITLKLGTKTVLDSGNYTSYSPSLGGSGASGTWGISITGNAATAYGLAVHTGRNNEANKVVRTDGSGYIQAGWINTTSGDNGTTAIDRVYASSDGYIRYYTPANFRQVLDVPTRTGGSASGTWGISVTGSSATTAAVSSSTYGSTTFTWRQESGTFAGQTGWASYLISSHGDGATYYNQTIIMPFWGAPQYSRLEGGTFKGPYTFLTTENYTSYALPLSGGNVTGSTQIASLGVGTAASGTAGEIRATNNITAYYSSDIRFKENIHEITSATSIVCAIGGKYFDWSDAYLADHGGEDGYFLQKQDFGVIAQDVEKVFPRAVRKRPDGSLAVDYEKLSALAFAAIREQQARLERLESLVNLLIGD